VNDHKVVNARSGASGTPRPRWVYGVNAVMRRLAVNPHSIREVRVAKGDARRRAQLAHTAARAGIPVYEIDSAALGQLTGSEAHQGVAALAAGFIYADLDAVIASAAGPLLLLDHVQDPHNFGALIRTAAAVGISAVIVPRHASVPVTGAVEKAAAGAVNDIPICEVPNVHRCLTDLRVLGYWSIGLSARADTSLYDLEIPGRPALVLGGETGLRPLVERTCDLRAAIPLRPEVESLNASVAGAVAMYEIARRLGLLDRLQRRC
jgi:23S rRNA (guanosine2251-2'-O)-methyltransferase